MSKLLEALRQRYRSPQEACEALGLDPAAVLPPAARFSLAADASTVTDKTTGQTYDPAIRPRHFRNPEDSMLTTLQRKLAKFAQDQDLPAKAGLQGHPKPNLDQDDPTGTPNGSAAAPDTDEMIAVIRAMLAKAPDPQGLLEALAALVSEQGSGAGTGDGLPQNNKGALDRRRGVRGAHDKRPALDTSIRAVNHAGFMKKFPFLANVDVWR